MTKLNEQNIELTPEQRRQMLMQLKLDFCPEHKPANKRMGYIEHHIWMDNKNRQGHKQHYCSKCKRWLFKCEMK